MSRTILTLTAVMLLTAACGGNGGDTRTTTGDGSGTATSTSTGTRRVLNGSVCGLLTAAEIEAVLKTGQPITATEGGGDDVDRSCSYVVQSVPVLSLTLLGEREREDWDALKNIPGTSVTGLSGGAEAAYVQLNNSNYVHKNGLQAAFQVLLPPANETTQSLGPRFAQTIADRLP